MSCFALHVPPPPPPHHLHKPLPIRRITHPIRRCMHVPLHPTHTHPQPPPIGMMTMMVGMATVQGREKKTLGSKERVAMGWPLEVGWISVSFFDCTVRCSVRCGEFCFALVFFADSLGLTLTVCVNVYFCTQCTLPILIYVLLPPPACLTLPPRRLYITRCQSSRPHSLRSSLFNCN